jgi:hypothetical protein
MYLHITHKISPSFKTLLSKAMTATDCRCARKIEGMPFSGLFSWTFGSKNKGYGAGCFCVTGDTKILHQLAITLK